MAKQLSGVIKSKPEKAAPASLIHGQFIEGVIEDQGSTSKLPEEDCGATDIEQSSQRQSHQPLLLAAGNQQDKNKMDQKEARRQLHQNQQEVYKLKKYYLQHQQQPKTLAQINALNESIFNIQKILNSQIPASAKYVHETASEYTIKNFITAVFGFKNIDKVLDNLKQGKVESKKRFLDKYPHIRDIEKFTFDVDLDENGDIEKYNVHYKATNTSSYDITSQTFLNNKEWVKYLTSAKIWPQIWSVGKPIKLSESKYLTYPKNARREGWGRHKIIDTKYLKQGSLGEPLHNFKVYVNNTDYFLSNLPPVKARWSTGKMLNQNLRDIRDVPFNYKEEPYFAMIAGMYIASFLSGVSLLNLKQSDTPNIIKSIARYHLYYQTRKFMRNPNLIDKYNISEVKKHIPIRYKDVNSTDTDDDGNYYAVKGATELTEHDYYSFIAYESKGLTKIGLELLQQSIESYVYCVLGAQASTRWAIVGHGAMSLQTQSVFRKKVEDTIIQSDQTVLISDMRKAIFDTNVVLNMAITPGMILVPSSMIILDKKIKGFNNILKLASSNMRFGVNTEVNAPKVQLEQSFQHQKPVEKTKPTQQSYKSVVPKNPNAGRTETLTLVVSVVGGVLVARYLL